MTDCPNGEMRDTLPDLLHDRLAPGERREVEAHVAACSECQAELALLGDVRASLARVRAVNVAQIAASIPAYRPAVALRSSKPVAGGWRIAAAILVLAAGGASAALWSHGANSPGAAGSPMSAPVVASAVLPRAERAQKTPGGAPAASVVPPSANSPTQAARVADALPHSTGPASVRELAVGTGSTGDLTADELNMLLKDIESLDAVPSTDVESGAVTPTRRGS